jgi:hypothetical protein
MGPHERFQNISNNYQCQGFNRIIDLRPPQSLKGQLEIYFFTIYSFICDETAFTNLFSIFDY